MTILKDQLELLRARDGNAFRPFGSGGSTHILNEKRDRLRLLKNERDRLRLLLSKGLGYVEGSHLDCAKEWIEHTKKDLGLE